MTRFVALISGKGGVGKTTFTVSLGQALAKLDKKVLLLDANLETPNLGLHLGIIQPKATLNQFLRKEKSLKGTIYEHKDCGFSMIPTSTSYIDYLKTNPQRLKKVFEHLENTYDFVLVDSPSGLGDQVSQVLKNTDETLVIVNPNNSSIMEGLKSVEMAKAYGNILPGVVLNMSSRWSRHELKKKEVEEVLGSQVLANIRHDKKVKKSLHRNLPVNYLYPSSRSAKEINKVAKYLVMES